MIKISRSERKEATNAAPLLLSLRSPRERKFFIPHPPSPSPHGEGAAQQNRAKHLVLPLQEKNKTQQRTTAEMLNY